MRMFSVQLRGKEIDVQIDRDYGYEPDTNAHDVDWHLVGLHAPTDLTEEEEQQVLDQIYSVICDPHYYDED